MHERSRQCRNGKCKLGWPGGKADILNETIYDAVIRELKEECMHLIGDELKKEHFHILYARKLSHYPLHFYALFALFIKDKRVITGPQNEYIKSMNINSEYGITSDIGYHQFFDFNKNRLSYNGTIIKKQKLYNSHGLKQLSRGICIQ